MNEFKRTKIKDFWRAKKVPFLSVSPSAVLKMDIWVHTAISGVLTVVLWPYFGVWSLLAIAGGVLIDGDHVFWYWVRKGKISLKDTYIYANNVGEKADVKEYSKAVLVCHTYEFLIVSIILAIIFKEFIPFVIGLVIHYILDIIDTKIKFKKVYFHKMFSKSAIIFFYNLFFKKNYYKNL